jgi:acyl carrier protein
MAAYVLDKHLQILPIGVPGELYIGGVGVGRGYLGREDLTRRHFVDDVVTGRQGSRLYRTGDRARWREDGNLEFLGRLDFTVKIRGFRIEVDEIEQAVRSHKSVHDCVVVATGEVTDRYLVAYVVLDMEQDEDETLLHEQIRHHLRERLPEHMIPAILRTLDELPVNSSGKVDRKKLPDPRASHTEPKDAKTAPESNGELEAGLLRIWRDVLPERAASLTDHFLDLGGHSLTAVEVSVRAQSELGLNVTARDVLRYPTIEGLLTAAGDPTVGVRRALTMPAPQTRPEDAEEPFPPTALQEAYWVGQSDELALGGVHAHLTTELEWPNFDVVAAERALNELVIRHDVLRLIVDPDGRQRVLASVPAYSI